MPELPEVETIRLGLEKYLVGHTIESIDKKRQDMLSGETSQIIGSKVIGVRRFGKGLVIDFGNSYSLVVHVKMTGQLIYVGSKVPEETNYSKEKVGILPHKHTHIIFYLDNDAILYYNDVRRFGWLKIVKTDDVSELSFFKNLGPEVLYNLTIEHFIKTVKSAAGPIKLLLMDQKKIAGIGNIYANDALYKAKIDPRRSAMQISSEEAERLFNAIEEVMKKGLEAGGSSEWNYVNALGETGNYQKIFLIYGKEGTKCKNCGTIIQKIQLGGRGTYFCSICQK